MMNVNHKNSWLFKMSNLITLFVLIKNLVNFIKGPWLLIDMIFLTSSID
jgi:hypothetical protein